MKLVAHVKRFIGLSSDVKPTTGYQLDGSDQTLSNVDLPAGSTSLETDTGDLPRWDGEKWRVVPEGGSAQTAIAEALNEVLIELRQLRIDFALLRLGMMSTGACKEVSRDDAELEYSTY